MNRISLIAGLVAAFTAPALAQDPEDFERQAISVFTNISVARAFCDLSPEMTEKADAVQSKLATLYPTTPLRDVEKFSFASNMFERADPTQRATLCGGISNVITTLNEQ